MDPIRPFLSKPISLFFQENSIRCLNCLWEGARKFILKQMSISSLMGRVWHIVLSNKVLTTCVILKVIFIGIRFLQRWKSTCHLGLSHKRLINMLRDIKNFSNTTYRNLSDDQTSSCPDWLLDLAPGTVVDLRSNRFTIEKLYEIQRMNQNRLNIQLSIFSQGEFFHFHIHNSILHVAITHNLIGEVKKILAMPVNVNEFNSFGNTPLMEACIVGREEIVALLLQHPQTDPNIKQGGRWAINAGKSAIDFAIEKFSMEECSDSLCYFQSIEKFLYYRLIVKQPNWESIDLMTENKNGKTLMEELGDSGFYQRIFEQAERKLGLLIHRASEESIIEWAIVTSLLQTRAYRGYVKDIDFNQYFRRTLYMLASKREDPEAFKVLKELAFEILSQKDYLLLNLKKADQFGYSFLHTAVTTRDIELVCDLVDNHGMREKINGVTVTNNTALMIASINNSREVVSFLLKRGANPALEDRNGRNALSLAIRMNATGAIQELVYFENLVNHIGGEGTPLMEAIDQDLEEVAEMLIPKMDDEHLYYSHNVPGLNSPKTALNMAIDKGMSGVVGMLIDRIYFLFNVVAPRLLEKIVLSDSENERAINCLLKILDKYPDRTKDLYTIIEKNKKSYNESLRIQSLLNTLHARMGSTDKLHDSLNSFLMGDHEKTIVFEFAGLRPERPVR